MASTNGRRARLALGAIVVALIVVFAARAAGWWGGDGDEAPRLYGNVEVREVELGFRVGGRIAEVLVDEGDKVAPGQVLARLDTQPLRDRLAGADAKVAAAGALPFVAALGAYNANSSTDLPGNFYATRISSRASWIKSIIGTSSTTSALTAARMAGTTSVPEPSSAAVFGIAAAMLLRRRRRRAL